MNIVFFAHPTFLASQSMPRFVNMLVCGMKRRGCKVQLFSPEAYLFRIPAPRMIRKYFGYVDQYIIFPLTVKRRLKNCDPDSLYVFTDHALGPWLPLIGRRPHVIHCHDFLAQHSAKLRIPENRTGWFGRRYQDFIRWGYSRGSHFICVSEKTRRDLHMFLPMKPSSSTVVYNGLNQAFQPCSPAISRTLFSDATGLELRDGYILHVGGNQWYKNRVGVIELYNAWRQIQDEILPLVMVGRAPDEKLRAARNASPFKKNIFFVKDLSDRFLPFAYAGATLFLFPSLAEGFGWPVAEAMASGCPVITTDVAPMTEVAGGAAFLIPARPREHVQAKVWAEAGAAVISKVVSLGPAERLLAVEAGLANAERFDPERALDQISEIYRQVWSGKTDQFIESASPSKLDVVME